MCLSKQLEHYVQTLINSNGCVSTTAKQHERLNMFLFWQLTNQGQISPFPLHRK